MWKLHGGHPETYTKISSNIQCDELFDKTSARSYSGKDGLESYAILPHFFYFTFFLLFVRVFFLNILYLLCMLCLVNVTEENKKQMDELCKLNYQFLKLV